MVNRKKKNCGNKILGNLIFSFEYAFHGFSSVNTFRIKNTISFYYAKKKKYENLSITPNPPPLSPKKKENRLIEIKITALECS